MRKIWNFIFTEITVLCLVRLPAPPLRRNFVNRSWKERLWVGWGDWPAKAASGSRPQFKPVSIKLATPQSRFKRSVNWASPYPHYCRIAILRGTKLAKLLYSGYIINIKTRFKVIPLFNRQHMKQGIYNLVLESCQLKWEIVSQEVLVSAYRKQLFIGWSQNLGWKIFKLCFIRLFFQIEVFSYILVVSATKLM